MRWRPNQEGEKGGREGTWAERRDQAEIESGGGWGREPVGGCIMARLLRALRGLPWLEVSGRPVRGCAGSGRGDSGRSSVAAAARSFRFHCPGCPGAASGEASRAWSW